MFTVIQVLMGSYLFFAFLYFISHSFFHAFKCYFSVFSSPASSFSHLPIQCLILIYCIQLNLLFPTLSTVFFLVISYMDRDLSLYPMSIAKYSQIRRCFTISLFFHICNTKYTIVRCVAWLHPLRKRHEIYPASCMYHHVCIVL